MEKAELWTVKQVCDLTGLTGKHLYYFHHEGVAKAADFSNYSVDDHDGYKLYDDAGVAKLQQIAMYYELGLKRNEIRDLMKAPDYDMNRALDILKTEMEEKRDRLNQHIAAVEQLRFVGTKNGIFEMFRHVSLQELGKNLLDLPQSPLGEYWNSCIETQEMDQLGESIGKLLHELSQLDTEMLAADAGLKIIREMFQVAIRHLGLIGYLFILGLFLSAMGEGSMSQDLANDLSIEITENHGKAAVSYLKQEGQLLLHEVAQTIALHHESIGGPFDNPEVIEMVSAIKQLLANHFGLKRNAEYRMIFEMLEIGPYTDSKDYLTYTLNALKYHCINS